MVNERQLNSGRIIINMRKQIYFEEIVWRFRLVHHKSHIYYPVTDADFRGKELCDYTRDVWLD
jgi:hypothetical protein